MNIKQLYEKTKEGYKAFIAKVSIDDITGLRDILDNKVSKDGDSMTGDLTLEDNNITANSFISMYYKEKNSYGTRIEHNKLSISASTPLSSSSTTITNSSINIKDTSSFGNFTTTISSDEITSPKYIKTDATNDDILLGDGSTASKSDFLSLSKDGVSTASLKFKGDNSTTTLKNNSISISIEDNQNSDDFFIVVGDKKLLDSSEPSNISLSKSIDANSAKSTTTYNTATLINKDNIVTYTFDSSNENNYGRAGIFANNNVCNIGAFKRSDSEDYVNSAYLYPDGLLINAEELSGRIRRKVELNLSNYIEITTEIGKEYKLDLDAAIKAGIFKETT